MEVFQSVSLYEAEFYEKRMGILNYLTRQMLTISNFQIHNYFCFIFPCCYFIGQMIYKNNLL